MIEFVRSVMRRYAPLRPFEGITRRRVTWIQVADEPTATEAPQGVTIIEEVEVK